MTQVKKEHTVTSLKCLANLGVDAACHLSVGNICSYRVAGVLCIMENIDPPTGSKSKQLWNSELLINHKYIEEEK